MSTDLLFKYLPGLPTSGARIELESSSPSDNSRTFILSFELKDGTSTPTTYDTRLYSFNLGRKGDCVTGGLRLTRDKCYWLFAHQNLALPDHTDTQILALRGPQHVLVVLPLTTDTCLGTLRGPLFEPEKDLIFARFEKSSSSSEAGQAVLAFADDINVAIKSAVEQARSLLGAPHIPNGPLPGSRIFENKLTYCTWNSLQPPTPTTAASALRALEHFHSIGVRPAAFLIDDAWQDVKSFKLQSFGSAQPFLDKFESLGEVVKAAKETYGVEHVGVWHTIQGYWQGVQPSRFSGRYKLVKVTKDGYPGPAEEEGFEYHIPHPDSIQRFFTDYYAILHAAGVTFTKCDNMASIDHIVSAVEVSFTESGEEVLGGPVDIVALRKAYIQAVMSAARAHLGAENVIWCMGMTPRVLLGDIGLGEKGTKRVVRNSDDYYPNEPDSHRYHIFTNTVNALLLNNLNVQPDLDMFQTHPYISPIGDISGTSTGLAQAAFHASFRVFGTGPVTITDAPMKSDPNVLRKIVGDLSPSPTSSSVVVQASSVFTVLNDIFDPRILEPGVGKGLKVYVDKTIGIWNVQSGSGKLVEFVTSSDIAQALRRPAPSLHAVLLHIQSSNPMNERTVLHNLANPLHPAAPIRLELDPLGWATVGVAVVEPVGSSGQVACAGLVDKYLASQGVSKASLSCHEGTNWSYTVVSECSGTLGLWLSSGISVKSVQSELIGENGVGKAQNTDLETVNLVDGGLLKLELAGKSRVLLQLESRGA